MAFSFRHLPVSDPGVTQNFEQLQPVLAALEERAAAANSELAALKPTSFVEVEGWTAKSTERSVFVRRDSAYVGRMYGTFKTTAIIPAATVLFTIPPGYRTAGLARYAITSPSTGTAFAATVLENGQVSTIELAAGMYVDFSSITYRLT